MKKIHYDEKASNETIESYMEYAGLVTDFSKALKPEGIVLTKEILANFEAKGPEYLAGVLEKATIEQYNAAGMMVNSVTHENIVHSSRSVASRFQNHHKELSDCRRDKRIPPNCFEIDEEGNPIFGTAEKNEIKKRFTVFLGKEDEELFHALEKYAGEINKIQEALKGKVNLPLLECIKNLCDGGNYATGGFLDLVLRRDTYFIQSDDGGIEVNPAYFIKNQNQFKPS